MWFKNLREDIKAAKNNDPAARNAFEIWLTYSGVHALSWHRVAYFFHKIKLKLLARIISQLGRFFTGIEIHPAAKIEGGVFIDHGSGVVIGETAEVHKGTVIYQGVTLGGTGKEHGKRHPTITENVTLSAGAKVLGGFTVGKGAKIGAGAVVLKEVPPYATVVGVPGRIVRIRTPEEEQTHHGIIAVKALNVEISEEEKQRKEEAAKEAARIAEEKRSGKKEKNNENL
ncbi:MAG: serine O-acetyltransferase [Clostridia bacterium]|nr:serine O-acetyltransferase [Clostridia bacterium]